MVPFNEASFRQVTRMFSAFVDDDGPLGYHRLDQRGRLHVQCQTCLYVWVAGDRCMYIGQVRRSTGDVADRFAGHHRHLEAYDGVWIVPLQNVIPARLLDTFERMLIDRYDPLHNRTWRRSA